jgi:hypothetical protein
MEILGIIVAILILGFTAWRIYIISKRGTIDSNAWAEIRVIGYQTIEDLVKLYNAKDDKNQFIDILFSMK